MRKIVCAATAYDVNGKRIVIADARHFFSNHVCLLEMLFTTYGEENVKEIQQGFILSNSVFIDRETAYTIAKETGQFLKGSFDQGKELFSENLYE